MSTPRDRRRAEQRRALRGTVITALANALPDRQDLDISLMLDTVRAATGIPLGHLAEHLACHPDALISGDPRCPVVLIRLTHALYDAGQPVVRPGCAGCGKVTLNLAQCGSGGLLCQMCRVRTRLSTCARCGREDTRIAARRAEGGICFPCYRVDPEVVEECGRCGRTRMPVTRRGDGTPLCLGCWTPPVHRCIHCGQDRPARVSGPDGSICRDCYRQRPRRCGRCGGVRVISKRATHGNPDLCGACNRGPDMPCAGCGQTRPSRRYRPDAAAAENSFGTCASPTGQPAGPTATSSTRWTTAPGCWRAG